MAQIINWLYLLLFVLLAFDFAQADNDFAQADNDFDQADIDFAQADINFDQAGNEFVRADILNVNLLIY